MRHKSRKRKEGIRPGRSCLSFLTVVLILCGMLVCGAYAGIPNSTGPGTYQSGNTSVSFTDSVKGKTPSLSLTEKFRTQKNGATLTNRPVLKSPATETKTGGTLPSRRAWGFSPGSSSWLSFSGQDVTIAGTGNGRAAWIETRETGQVLVVFDSVSGNVTVINPPPGCGPTISAAVQGDLAAVSGMVNTSGAIWVVNPKTPGTTRITPLVAGDLNLAPATDGVSVAWVNINQDGSQIQSWDSRDGGIVSESRREPGVIRTNPVISDGYVIWEENRDGSRELFVRDRKDGSSFPLTPSGPGEAYTHPSLAKTRLVFESLSEGVFRIGTCDLPDTAVTLIASDHPGCRLTAPDVLENEAVAIEEYPDHDNLVLVSLADGSQKTVVTNRAGVHIASPVLAEDHIAWKELREGVWNLRVILETKARLPAASFTMNTTLLKTTRTVSFCDTSAGNPTAWFWEFGDGTVSQEENPLHMYTENGHYTVSLTISTGWLRDRVVVTDAVSVNSPPVPEVQVHGSAGPAPLTVEFSGPATADDWTWSFGDGTSGKGQHVTHTFVEAGTYAVILDTCSDEGCSRASFPIIVFSSASSTINTSLQGVSVTRNNGVEEVLLDTDLLNRTGTTCESRKNQVILYPPAASGIRSVIITTPDKEAPGTNGSSVRFSAGKVEIEALPLSLPERTGAFSPYGAFTLRFPQYPEPFVMPWRFYENASPAIRDDLVTAANAADYNGITAYGQTLSFPGKVPSGAVLKVVTIGTGQEFVREYGGTDAIRIIGVTENGTGSLLATTPVPGQSQDGVVVFEAYPPGQYTDLTLVAASKSGNPLQMAYMSTKSRVPGPASPAPSSSGSGSGGGSGGYSGGLTASTAGAVRPVNGGSQAENPSSSGNGAFGAPVTGRMEKQEIPEQEVSTSQTLGPAAPSPEPAASDVPPPPPPKTTPLGIFSNMLVFVLGRSAMEPGIALLLVIGTNVTMLLAWLWGRSP